MKNNKSGISKLTRSLLVLSVILVFQNHLSAQSISVYQYRHVPADKVNDFIYRETTYWSEVAQKGIENGNLEFWALLQKVGGYDLENSSNFLFVNTFKDLDNMGNVWNASAVFPDVPMDEIETGSLSTTTSMFFLRGEGWEQHDGAVPDNDFRFIKMNYINSSNPANLISLEKEYWSPFIKSAMNENKTSQRAWGNATVLSPSGEDIKFNTVSYDIYPSLKEALDPRWDESVVFPQEGLNKINELELNRRGSVVYRIVKVVSAN